MLFLNQIVDVRNADLSREAGIDSSATGTGAVQIGTGVVGVDYVFRLHAQALEIGVEQRSVGVDVEHARNADAQLLAILHEGDALFGGLVPELCYRNRVGHQLRIRGAENFAGGEIHEVGILVFDLVDAGLDVFHVVDIFDQTLFAGGDDQALFAVHQRNLGDFLNGDYAQFIFGCGSDIDESAQAVILAEIAAGRFVAGGAVLNFSDSIEADEGCLLAVLP